MKKLKLDCLNCKIKIIKSDRVNENDKNVKK